MNSCIDTTHSTEEILVHRNIDCKKDLRHARNFVSAIRTELDIAVDRYNDLVFPEYLDVFTRTVHDSVNGMYSSFQQNMLMNKRMLRDGHTKESFKKYAKTLIGGAIDAVDLQMDIHSFIFVYKPEIQVMLDSMQSISYDNDYVLYVRQLDTKQLENLYEDFSKSEYFRYAVGWEAVYSHSDNTYKADNNNPYIRLVFQKDIQEKWDQEVARLSKCC